MTLVNLTFDLLEHFHQRSVCDHPALEILDEVHQLNPVGLVHWKTDGTLKKCTAFRALERSSKHSPPVFIDCSLFLIG
jgi:hypothetical protein